MITRPIAEQVCGQSAAITLAKAVLRYGLSVSTSRDCPASSGFRSPLRRSTVAPAVAAGRDTDGFAPKVEPPHAAAKLAGQRVVRVRIDPT
jgi:hypothetical protein